LFLFFADQGADLGGGFVASLFGDHFERDRRTEDADGEEAAAGAGSAADVRRRRGLEGDEGEAFRTVAVDRTRRADAVGAEEGEEAGEGGGQLVRREGGRTVEGELGFARPVGVGEEG